MFVWRCFMQSSGLLRTGIQTSRQGESCTRSQYHALTSWNVLPQCWKMTEKKMNIFKMFWSPRLFAEIVAHLDSFRLVFWRPNSQTGPPNFGSMTSRASRKFLKEGSVPENLKPASVRGKSEASRVSAIRCLGPGKSRQFFWTQKLSNNETQSWASF